MKQIRWCDMVGDKWIVRKFEGIIESETEETISFRYRKKIITLKKDECFIYG